MELNFNLDNIIIAKLTNGLEIIGYDVSEEGSPDHKLENAYFIELTIDTENSTQTTTVFKPKFEPLSLLVDPKESVNSEIDVTLPASTVLFKLPVHPNVIPHYKGMFSTIIV